LDAFTVNPRELAAHLGEPSLLAAAWNSFLYPAFGRIDSARNDGQGNDDDVAPPLLKTLVGFTNTMTPGHTAPVIIAAFRDHKTDDIVDELIGETEFFSPAEFHEAIITSKVNSMTSVNSKEPLRSMARQARGMSCLARWWPSDRMRAFRINLAVVQGARESRQCWWKNGFVSHASSILRWALHLPRRDRVLPYGNNDYDFLDIERNRTKSASYYYFLIDVFWSH